MIVIDEWNALGSEKVEIWKVIKSVKLEVLVSSSYSCHKVGHFALKYQSKTEINFVDEKVPEDIYLFKCIWIGQQICIIPKIEEKNFPKLIAK